VGAQAAPRQPSGRLLAGYFLEARVETIHGPEMVALATLDEPQTHNPGDGGDHDNNEVYQALLLLERST
jgi:hypothetical protein